MKSHLKTKSILSRRQLIPISLLASSFVGPLACSSDPGITDPNASKGPAGVGGAIASAVGGGPGAVGGTTAINPNPGGEIEVGDGDGDGEPAGTGGVPAVQDGGMLALTPEQVAEIEMAECADVTGEADKLPAAIQFVVDVSGSMGYDAPTTGGMEKWDVALPALLDALDGIDDNMAVGLQLYPTEDVRSTSGQGQGRPVGGGGAGLPVGAGGNIGSPMSSGGADAGSGGAGAGFEPSDYCADARGRVEIAEMEALGSPHRTLLSSTLETTALPIGTPTHDAYVNALEESLKLYPATGNKFMILMTDGAPTQLIGCGPNELEGTPTEPIIEAVAAAYAEGISTFIIGSPGTEGTNGGTARPGESDVDTRPWLSAAAKAGGTGPDGCTIEGPNFCHLDMTTSPDFGVALGEALDGIADKVAATCSFEVPTVDGEEIDPALTNVMINWSAGNSDLVLHDNVGACTEGWVWGPGGEIELCADTCTRIETDSDAIVSVSLGCTVEELVITVQ